MPNNQRIHYAVQQVGFAALGENTFTALHGLQSVGIDTTFELTQIFEIGQISIYENLEQLPSISCTLEKVIDGYAPAYLVATKGATSPSLAGRSNVRASVGLSIFSDVQDSASGTPLSQCTLSGMYPSAVSYNVQVDGSATESLTLVGNNKVWSNSFDITTFDNDDEPLALTQGSGGVQQRENVKLGEASTLVSLLPTDIPGVTASGTVAFANNEFSAKLQSIRVSTNLGREELFELGRRGPYFRYVSFPVSVQTDIDVLSQTGDSVEALEDSESNINDQTIVVQFDEGLKLDMGVKNKLSSVSYGGANAGQNGGNATMTYSYLNFNDLTVTHPEDPSEL